MSESFPNFWKFKDDLFLGSKEGLYFYTNNQLNWSILNNIKTSYSVLNYTINVCNFYLSENNKPIISVESESDLEDLFSCVFAIKNILFSSECEFFDKLLMILTKSGCLAVQKQKSFTNNYNGSSIEILDDDYLLLDTLTKLKYRTINFFDVNNTDTNYSIVSNDIINTTDYQILIFTSNNKKQIISSKNRNVRYVDNKYIIPKENIIEIVNNNEWVKENNCY